MIAIHHAPPLHRLHRFVEFYSLWRRYSASRWTALCIAWRVA